MLLDEGKVEAYRAKIKFPHAVQGGGPSGRRQFEAD